jgi:hypothetical protein
MPDDVSVEQRKLALLKHVLIAACRTEVGGDTVDAIHTVFCPRTFNVCPSCELARPIEITVSDSSSHANFEGNWDQLHDWDSSRSLNIQSAVEQQINFELSQEDLSNCITIDIESTIEFWVRQRSDMMALAEASNTANEETPLLTTCFKNRFVVNNDTFHVKYARTSVWMNLESPTYSFIAEKAAEKMRRSTISHKEYWDVVDKHKSLEVHKNIDEAPTPLPSQKDDEAIATESNMKAECVQSPALRSILESKKIAQKLHVDLLTWGAVPEVPESDIMPNANSVLATSGATRSAAINIDPTAMSSAESLASTPTLPQFDAPHATKKKGQFRRWW